MTPRLTRRVLPADPRTRIPDLPGAAAIAVRGDGGPSLPMGKP